MIKMVTVTVNMSDGLANLCNLGKETIREGMNKTAQDLIRNLQINSPVDHGLLKQWAVTSESDSEVTIQSPAIYAAYVNYGHSQQPGRFIPGSWSGDKFVYNPDSKTGMVLKASSVEGKHFVEDSIEQTQSRIAEFFTINGG